MAALRRTPIRDKDLQGLKYFKVLGTVLDIQEGDEERRPDSPEASLYQWLTYLQGEAIDALSGEL